MWRSFKRTKLGRFLFRERNDVVERRVDLEPGEDTSDPEPGEDTFDPVPVQNVEPAQGPVQDVQPAPARRVGPYDNPEKKKCRSDVISHAIRCLTTGRQTSACVQRSHVRRVWKQLQESGESQVFYNPQVIKSIETEMTQWEILHEGRIQSRKPSELTVCYLGGENPINDLKVLVDNGVLPQNVWAVEKKSKKIKEAWEAIKGSTFRNVRLFEGDILSFMKDFPGNFDIIYFDTCGTLPSDTQDTLKFIGYVFQYNKLTSPGALITNFSFPPKQSTSNSKEKDQIGQLVTEYLKYRLDNTLMSKGSPEGNAEYLGQMTIEQNYGDYITYQVIDSAYLYIPALRMLTSTNPLWDQMLRTKRGFHDFLEKCKKSYLKVGSINELVGDTSEVSPMWMCGFALEELKNYNPQREAWISEILPNWESTPNLETEKLPLLLLTHLLSHYNFFISKFTNEKFRAKCLKPLEDALREMQYPKFAHTVDLESTKSLVAGLLYGQMAYPSFPVVDKMLRLHYTGNERQMFTDVFIFDQCRYVYQQFPSISCAFFAITEPAQQIVFRMVVDGLRKHLEGICSKDVFPYCHVASVDPVPLGEIGFPDSGPKIPKRREVNVFE